MFVAAAPRTWERASHRADQLVPGRRRDRERRRDPAPGTTIKPTTPITLTFSKPISKALGSSLPPVTPSTAGSWRTLNAHTIQFVPSGLWLRARAPSSLALPAGVRLVGGEGNAGTWTVPQGSTLRLQQLLSMLGYLPVKFKYAGGGVDLAPAADGGRRGRSAEGQLQLALHEHAVGAHAGMAARARSETMTKGAIMAFENTEGMTTDGVAGAAVWKALINAAVAGKAQHFGYTFVQVSRGQSRRPSRPGTTGRPSSRASSTPASAAGGRRRASSPCSSTRCR